MNDVADREDVLLYTHIVHRSELFFGQRKVTVLTFGRQEEFGADGSTAVFSMNLVSPFP